MSNGTSRYDRMKAAWRLKLHNYDAQPVWFQSLEYIESVQLLLT